jgi:hypothetical protein
MLLTFLYQVEASHARYFDETIYFKTREALLRHTLEATLGFVQPWGDGRISVEGKAHLDDHRRHEAEIEAEVSLRLARGVSFVVEAELQRIKDQVNLPRGEATDEEVLLQRRELGTEYEYGATVGSGSRSGRS